MLTVIGAVTVLVVIVGVTRPLVIMLARPLVHSDPVDRVDAIVILGQGTYLDGTLAPSTASCVLHGIRLLRQGAANLLILSGGSHRGNPMTDADAMADVIRTLGSSAPNVVLERNATTLVDHARAVAAIVRQRNLTTVAVVSPPLRSRRTALTFQRAGVKAVVASGMNADDVNRVLLVGRDDALGRLALMAEITAEYLAIGYYRARGWL